MVYSVTTTGVGTSEIAERIARAAARLFATEGYDATSVRNIVEAAEVTKPTLYYYFDSKEALARALLMAPIDKLATGMREVVASSAPATAKLVAIIEQHFELCREDPDRARFAFSIVFGPRNSHLATVLGEVGESLTELVTHVVRGLADENAVVRHRLDECVAAVRGLIMIYMMDFLYREITLDAGLAERLVVDLLSGFADRVARPVGPEGAVS